jgi:tetratricopeptide (TPR) repeat protein
MSEAPSETLAADTAAIVQDVTALLQRSEVPQAVELAKAALARGVEAPLLLNLRAYWLEGQNRPGEALLDLRRAHDIAPEDPAIANAFGLCLAKLGRMDEALAAFRKCVALAPTFGPGHFNCGWVLEELGELDDAQAAFAEAARIDPATPDPWARRAALAARRARWDAARGFAEQALALDPSHGPAAISLAGAELSAKSYAASRARLGRLVDSPRVSPQDRATAIGLLGDVLDAQGLYREAFTAYSASNTLFKAVFAEKPAIQAEMPMSE